MGGGETLVCKRWSENKRHAQGRKRFQEDFHARLLSTSQSFFCHREGMQRDVLL